MPRVPRFLTLCVYALFGVCPILFFTDLTRNPYYTQIALLNILICVCWLLWIRDAWVQGEWLWVRSPLDPVLWALMIVCLLSWVSSFIQHPHFRSPIYSEGSRSYIFLITNTYLVYAAAVRFMERERLKRLLYITYLVTAAASIYGIAQYFGTEWIWPHNLNPYGSRPVSTFGNPNFMSSYLAMVLPIAVADFIFRFTGLSRVPLFVVIMSAVGALNATLTRSSWAGGFVALMVIGLSIVLSRELWPKIRKPVGILAVALVIMVAAWPKSSSAAYSETVLGRLTEVRQVASGTYGAVTQRLLIWLGAWQMVEDHPLLGKGWGAFELFYPYYQGSQLDKKMFFYYRTHANNAHNEVLEHWSQIGTVGLGIVVMVWLIFFRTGVSIATRLPQPWKGLEWGFIGGVFGMLIDNLLNVSVHFAVPAFIFWWWVGGAMALDPEALEVKRVPLQTLGRRWMLILAAVGLVCLAGRSAMMWAAEVYFFKGFKLSKQGVDLVKAEKYLEKAYAMHHLEVNNNYELANVNARLGKKDVALEMYQRALDANAGYDEIYFNRATMLMQSGREDEAIQNYRRVLGINPLSRDAYNALGGLYMKDLAKYGEAAEALYLRAVAVYSDDRDLWNNLGYLYTQRRNWSGAEKAYRRALEIDPNFTLARQNLAVIEANVRKENASKGSAPRP